MHYQHVEKILYPEESAWLYAKLLQEIPWKQVRYYKPEAGIITTPRLTWCCGFYQKRHHKLHLPDEVCPNPIPEWLLPLKDLTEGYLSQEFNLILLSYYRDGEDNMAFCSDYENLLDPPPVIASIALGNSRPFLLKNKTTKQTQSFSLAAGDLFVMQNNCHEDYLYSVPGTSSALPKISISFRKVTNEADLKNYYKYNYLSALL